MPSPCVSSAVAPSVRRSRRTRDQPLEEQSTGQGRKSFLSGGSRPWTPTRGARDAFRARKQARGGGECTKRGTSGRATRGPGTLMLELDAQDVAFRAADVLDRVDDGLAPRERAGLALAGPGLRAVDRHLHVPIREVDAQPVRVAVARLGL